MNNDKILAKTILMLTAAIKVNICIVHNRCKRDMIEIGLDMENWETLAADRGRWRINCSACLDEGELRIRKEAMARR